MLRAALPVLALATLLAACEPQKPAPVQVQAMVVDNLGHYVPTTVSLTTLSDVVALEGAAARLIGGARIVVDPDDPLLPLVKSDAQLRDVYVKAEGLPPRANLVELEGVLWPADFHSWSLVTTYFNFEQAYLYFQQNGVPAEAMVDPRTGSGATVYYFPEFTFTETSSRPLEDNALFFSPVQAFAVLPFDQLQTVPMAMNAGIVGHEFAHRIWNLSVFGGQAIPAPFTRWNNGLTATTPLNVLKSFDEGLADLHAYGVSCNQSTGCNARFLAHSLGEASAAPRDFTEYSKHCINPTLRTALETLQIGPFMAQGMEYRVGSVIAAALHRASFPHKRETLQRALIAAYDDPGGQSPGFRQLIESNLEQPASVTLAAFSRSILQHLTDPQLKLDTCNALMDHLQLSRAELTGKTGEAMACPAAATGGTICPDLQ